MFFFFDKDESIFENIKHILEDGTEYWNARELQHPDAGKFGYGPGTWSDGPDGKGHWKDPGGWYFSHGQHSFGNPPAMAMVHARDAILEQLTAIAREVFT